MMGVLGVAGRSPQCIEEGGFVERVFSISDAPMFERVMSDEEICKAVVETILDVELVGIKYHETEHSIEPRFGRRGVRLDAYLKDGSSVYDIEMQSYYQEGLCRRFRYYQSAIDTELLEKGREYTLLPESFIIFICTEDPFDCGFPRYSIERLCEEDPSMDVSCGAHWIILNARSYGDVSREGLRNLLEYVDRGVANRDPLVQRIDRRVVEANNDRKWVNEMFVGLTIEEDARIKVNMARRHYREVGLEEGRAEGRALGLEEGRAEGRAEGRKEGISEGRVEAERRYGLLISRLLDSGRVDDLKRAADDCEYRERLYAECGI